MVEKQFGDRSGGVVVRFRLPAEVNADTAFVVGDFNDWSTSSHAMEREDGAFTADVALEPGRAYRFRYLLDEQRWENDWAADAYEPNEFGGDDSVIDLTDVAPSTPPSTGKAQPRVARRAKKSERTS